MSTEYKKLIIKKYPKLPGRKTSESRYWKKFKSPILIKEYAAVTDISFSKTAPYDFAVTSSTRVQIYSSKTHSVKKTVSRFKDTAYSGTIRQDGKLIVAGDATGLVQIFDANSRSVLRSLNEHTLPVHITKFSPNNTQLLSTSDDKSVKIWDISSQVSTQTFTEHTDYVRAGLISADNAHLILSGSYDQTVRLWDLRSNQCAITMYHGAPVEDILLFPSGGVAVSAGGPTLRIWDMLMGGRCVHALSNHQKTITSLCFDSDATRLLTGSLDHHVKVLNVQDYKVVHSVKYPAPVLTVALSPDDAHLVAGMSNGLLSIRQRQVHTAETATKNAQTRTPSGGSYQHFFRGQRHLSTMDDFLVESRRRKRLRNYDTYLKEFKYGNALDVVLRTGQAPVVIISLLQELIHRDGLRIALSGRDDITLEPIIQFLVRNIAIPKYTSLLIDVANAVIDMYSSVLGQSPLIDELFHRLSEKVRQEIIFQQELMRVLGSLKMVLARSSTSGPTSAATVGASSRIGSPVGAGLI